MRAYVKFLFSIFCLLLGGCSTASRINVTVDTILDKQELPNGFSRGDVFSILSDAKDQPELLTKEIQRKIEKVLIGKGYKVGFSEADYFLIFRYANSSTSQKVDVTVPSQSSIYATKSSANIYQSPSYSSSYDVITWHNALAMFVYDAKEFNNKKEEKLLWKGAAASSGTFGDFRYVSNFLLYPLFEYFGKSTERIVNVSYPTDSSEIEDFAKQISFLGDEKSENLVKENTQ